MIFAEDLILYGQQYNMEVQFLLIKAKE